MTPLRITIPGRPIPKGRPRFARMGQHVRTFTDKATLTRENWIRQCALQAMSAVPGLAFPLDCPLAVRVEFHVARPKSAPRRVTRPATKPDLDNLLKAVLDGLSLAGLFTNDSRIVAIEASKAFASGPELTVVEVREAA